MQGYSEYVKYIESNKEAFFKSKESYIFWQPFKEYAHMLIFILPLLLFFGFLYARTKKKQLMNVDYNPVVKIISAHISLILALPLVWYTLTLLYHVLPKTLSSANQKCTNMQCKSAPLRNTYLAEISNSPASLFCFNL
mgnify:CR=1 FL=1